MNLTFSYKVMILPGSGGVEEYEIYLGSDIFCHLSDSDFQIFHRMCLKSGNKCLKRKEEVI